MKQYNVVLSMLLTKKLVPVSPALLFSFFLFYASRCPPHRFVALVRLGLSMFLGRTRPPANLLVLPPNAWRHTNWADTRETPWKCTTNEQSPTKCTLCPAEKKRRRKKQKSAVRPQAANSFPKLQSGWNFLRRDRDTLRINMLASLRVSLASKWREQSLTYVAAREL